MPIIQFSSGSCENVSYISFYITNLSLSLEVNCFDFVGHDLEMHIAHTTFWLNGVSDKTNYALFNYVFLIMNSFLKDSKP